MSRAESYGGIDRFRITAALLIVAIHTSPLSTYSPELDFMLTHIVARVAVPFFLMITGYFLLPQYLSQKKSNILPLISFIKKIALIYALATIIYLPFSLYAEHYTQDSSLSDILKSIFFDGTFYHLWYLPATIMGVLLLYLFGRRYSLKTITIIAAVLYLFGLLGDSYYGLVSHIPFLSSAYENLFALFSYTRNGIFYTPIFLVMGALLANSAHHHTQCQNIVSFLISLLLMLFEGTIIQQLGWARHDSMYLSLLPCTFFLFKVLLNCHGNAVRNLRLVSMLIYILHPFFIIVLRNIARFGEHTDILINNSLVKYFLVCLLSAVFAILLTMLHNIRRTHQNTANFHSGRAWIELEMPNLRHNVNVLRSILPDNCLLMPAVKANAYGHCAVQICQELNSLGIRAFCVATVLEGVQLKKHGIKGDILVLGYTHPAQFALLRRYNLLQTVINEEYAILLNSYGKKIRVHIKIDTGMHRLGENFMHINQLINIFKYKNLVVEGVYTHLCTANSQIQADKNFTQLQIARFYQAIEQIKKQGYNCLKLHIQSSDGVLQHPELQCDYARIGIALYGVLSSKEELKSCPVSLSPVLSVKTRIALVRPLMRGESVGYGLKFTATHDMQIAILTIGYADGIPRCLSCGVGNVLVNGHRAPIIGFICMDQMLIDITETANVKSGDIAVIIGKSAEEEITVCEVAEQAKTISNEILSRLGSRLERKFI